MLTLNQLEQSLQHYAWLFIKGQELTAELTGTVGNQEIKIQAQENKIKEERK